jgi:hypothetical protein
MMPNAATRSCGGRVDLEVVDHSEVPTEQSAETPKPMNLREIVYPAAGGRGPYRTAAVIRTL